MRIMINTLLYIMVIVANIRRYNGDCHLSLNISITNRISMPIDTQKFINYVIISAIWVLEYLFQLLLVNTTKWPMRSAISNSSISIVRNLVIRSP